MITLVVPTYNRPGYLKRLLQYYGSEKFPYSIKIADGSTEDVKKINQLTISSQSNLAVEHCTYGPDKPPLFRIVDILKTVRTKYCAICADDDFLTVEGIARSMDFMDKNSDFAAAHGRYIDFWLEQSRPETRFCWMPAYSGASITQATAILRLTQPFPRNLAPVFYAVYPTGLLRTILTETHKYTDDVRFGEYLPLLLTLVYGKIECLDVFYAAREYNRVSAGQSSKTLVDFIGDGTYELKYAKFQRCLSSHLQNECKIDVKQSNAIVDKAMWAYIMKRYPSKTRVKIEARIRKMLRRILPDKVFGASKKLYLAMTVAPDVESQQESSEGWFSKECIDSFDIIRELVLGSVEVETKRTSAT